MTAATLESPLRTSRRAAPVSARAIFYTPAVAFNFRQPEVPRHVFRAEAERAFAAHAPGGEIVLDLGPQMGLDYPATTPNLLARYLVVRQGEELAACRRASSEVYYVIRGDGVTTQDGQPITWSAGDVFVLPAGSRVRHAARHDAVLYLVTDEPLFSFCGASAPTAAAARVQPTHYAAAETMEALASISHRPTGEIAGRAVFFTNPESERTRTIAPFIGANINALTPGEDQQPHRHNAAAITLAIEADRVHSLIEGERIDWIPGAVMVTPPGLLHSHHSRGTRDMLSFVVQDSGLHYYARTVGFSFGEHA